MLNVQFLTVSIVYQAQVVQHVQPISLSSTVYAYPHVLKAMLLHMMLTTTQYAFRVLVDVYHVQLLSIIVKYVRRTYRFKQMGHVLLYPIIARQTNILIHLVRVLIASKAV